ncbi:Leucyl-tRNA synthetase, mitochondrial [Yamadazyma tenuis]|uniref:Leucyl-tRNA synthetase, mitochondrial n=1 Tax=Candida tenuis TaxID=2315449 RepID=UPI0027A89860|nr:Leucyl-tRNA synthetase, mitochondrial [Yamadazyma tenuis]
MNKRSSILSIRQGPRLLGVVSTCRIAASSISFFRAYSVSLNSLDAKWTKKWKQLTSNKGLNPKKFTIDDTADPFYALVMFPYPSGILHMGHVRVYTISDVISRFKRLQGKHVIHPMGWDAFGLPAENAAIERNINPRVWTESNIGKMKQQMELVLADFDWERELATCNPDYYKWTQKVFLLLHQHGLAYKKEAEINWDPVDKTVLANEQVDSNGRSWRSGAKVEKKNLSQWFIGITKYAEALNADLEVLQQWPDKVKAMQKHWIGESHGTEITIPINDSAFPTVDVFTSRPDTVFSIQFLALSLNHPITLKAAETDRELQSFIESAKNVDADSKDGYLLKNIKASRPLDPSDTKLEQYDMPVYVAPYVLNSYGSGAVMGCPAHDQRDFEFWKIHNPNVQVVVSVGPSQMKSSPNWKIPYCGKEGILHDNSTISNGVKDLRRYKGMDAKTAGDEITHVLEALGIGKKKTNYRIRDWLISRQRYWGAPIPIVYCDHCGTVPVPDSDLPVRLPDLQGNDFGKGNPLENLDSFVSTTCPSCGGHAKRDTDTMDTFMDSSWYFFRYLDSKNELEPFNKFKVNKHLPVDMYLGGIEHAILHLLYTRFISKFLGNIGMWEGNQLNNEPIVRLVTQGMVQGLTFIDPDTGKFLKPEEIDKSDPQNPMIIATGKVPLNSYEKMSKSKYNGVDPAETVQKYGADATRAHILFQAPISDSLNWNEDQIQGVDRWLRRVIALEDSIVNYDDSSKMGAKKQAFKNVNLNGIEYENIELTDLEVSLFNQTNEFIQKIDNSINVDLSFNTVISDLMKYTNTLTSAIKADERVSKALLVDAYKKLLVIMSPVTPCVAEESWEMLSLDLGIPWKSIMLEAFPEVQKIGSMSVNYNIFINGKSRLSFSQTKDFHLEAEEKILDTIFDHKVIHKFASRGKIKKIIKKSGLISLVLQK